MDELKILKKILDLMKENREKDYSINAKMTLREQQIYFLSRNDAFGDCYKLILNSIENKEYKKYVVEELDKYFQELFYNNTSEESK